MSGVQPPPLRHPGPPPALPERPEGAPLARTPSTPPDRWSPWMGPLALGAGLAVVLLVGAIASAIAVGAGASADDIPPGLSIGLTYFQDAIFVVAALVFARSVARPRARHFGLTAPRRVWRAVGILVAVWVGFYVFSAAWIAIVGGDASDDLPDELGVKGSDVALVLVMVLVTVCAPIAEETLFRGLFFRALRNWHGMWPAAILTGAVFGGIHIGSADAVALLPLAVFGFGLCLLYHWSGSLYPAIALHALNNSVAFGVSQDWDWQIPIVMAGATAASLLLALLLARLLDRRGAGDRTEPAAA